MKTLTEKEQRRKDYLKEYNKKYRALYAKELDKKCWESRKRRSQSDINVAFRLILTVAKTRSNKINREFGIDLEYVNLLWSRQKGICKLSGLPMSMGVGTKNKVSIDRINSNKGYVKGNCQLVTWEVNQAKASLMQSEFIKMSKAVAKNN